MQHYWKRVQSCSCISHTKNTNPKRHKQTKSDFALGIDYSDLKPAGDIHHSSQQGLPITISAAVSVYKHQSPFPVWWSGKSQLTVMGLPNTQSRVEQSRAPAPSVSTQPRLSTLSQPPWLLISPCTSQLWESSPCSSMWLRSTLPAWIICLGIIRLPWLKALMRCWSHHPISRLSPNASHGTARKDWCKNSKWCVTWKGAIRIARTHSLSARPLEIRGYTDL